jgi:hypothetical protein
LYNTSDAIGGTFVHELKKIFLRKTPRWRKRRRDTSDQLSFTTRHMNRAVAIQQTHLETKRETIRNQLRAPSEEQRDAGRSIDVQRLTYMDGELLPYMKLAEIRADLLINVNVALLKGGI